MSETFFSANDLIVNNGFVRNPNRYYSEEYFEKIPSMNTFFILPTTVGNTDFNIVQPGGSFLKNAYIVCLSAPTITSGNVGISISHSSVQEVAPVNSNKIVGIATNIISGHTTMTVNTIVQIFPTDLLVIPQANAASTSAGFNVLLTSRILYCRVTTSQDASVVGRFALITEFCDINTGSSPLNQNYYLSVTGTGSYTTANGLFPSNYAIDSGGIILKTAGEVNDEVILINKNFERSTVGLWKTDREIEWECKIKTPDSAGGIADLCIWAGLKITNTHLYTNASDTDQAYFLYSTDTTGGGVDTDGKLYFIYSTSNGVAKANYITNLGLKLYHNKLYNLKIRIDGDMKISIYVDNSQVGISNTTAAALATNSIDKSLALTNKDLKPYIGIKNVGTGGSKNLIVCYQKLSKIIK